MILPTKGLSPQRALITVGSHVLAELAESGLAVGSLWENVRRRIEEKTTETVTFEWFVLSLDLLHALGAIEQSGTGAVQVTPQ